MLLAEIRHIEKVRKEVSAWQTTQPRFKGREAQCAIIEWELNKTGFTMYDMSDTKKLFNLNANQLFTKVDQFVIVN